MSGRRLEQMRGIFARKKLVALLVLVALTAGVTATALSSSPGLPEVEDYTLPEVAWAPVPGWHPGDDDIVAVAVDEEEEGEPQGKTDSLLDPERAIEAAEDAVRPASTGDDAEACFAASRALSSFDAGALSNRQLEIRLSDAKQVAASSTMRRAIESAEQRGATLPACPPRP